MNDISKKYSVYDINTLKIILNMNLTLSKKAHMYKDLVTSTEIKKIINETKKISSLYYEKLLNTLV